MFATPGELAWHQRTTAAGGAPALKGAEPPQPPAMSVTLQTAVLPVQGHSMQWQIATAMYVPSHCDQVHTTARAAHTAAVGASQPTTREGTLPANALAVSPS